MWFRIIRFGEQAEENNKMVTIDIIKESIF
jgi:hypothetical protein